MALQTSSSRIKLIARFRKKEIWSMATAEELIAQAHNLTTNELAKVSAAFERELRLAKIREAQSKFTHLSNSSEDFARNKINEIEIEDGKFNRS